MTVSRRGFLQRSFGAAVALRSIPLIPFAPSSTTANTSVPDSHLSPILLDENENAYGTSENVLQEMRSALRYCNRYPNSAKDLLLKEIARYHQVEPSHVIAGCGSTEILRSCAHAFLAPGRQLVLADPTYDALTDFAQETGATAIRVRLNHRYEHDLRGMLAGVDKATTLVYICNPNNPTGTLTPRADLERFIAKLPAHTYVLVDEAYHHYAGTSANYASFIEHPVNDARVIVTRTFSTVYALAGLRVGYAVAAAPTVAKIARRQLWASVNAVATGAASAALKDSAFLQLSVERNVNDRQEFFNEAQGRQLKPLDSHTNFFMMDVGRPAKNVIEHFRRHGILIGPEFPAMNTYIRVTLGQPEEMREFWRVWDLLPVINMKM